MSHYLQERMLLIETLVFEIFGLNVILSKDISGYLICMPFIHPNFIVCPSYYEEECLSSKFDRTFL